MTSYSHLGRFVEELYCNILISLVAGLAVSEFAETIPGSKGAASGYRFYRRTIAGI